ncbi:sugar phosphate isomerase/epimerase family protein [Haloferula sp.]|uniref:sugar phosphate isomerase/epimerase family protein n=1 Tax=Haloferula sp. TaxID=2497595 RepID=UPI00329A8592
MNNVGLCTWSLKNDLDEITRTMDAAKLSSLHLEVVAFEPFKAAIEEHGWKVSCAMIGFPQEDYSTMERIRITGGIMPDDCWEENKALVLDAISKTAAMGIAYLSTHAGFIDHNDAEGYSRFRSRILELADAAAAASIMLLMETGQETAADLRDCLEDLNHQALGVNFDPANMILYGKGNPIEAVKVLGPWIKHVHIKDAIASETPGEWGSEVPWGEGDVDCGAFLDALKEVPYSGPVAIEREAGDTRSADIKLAADRLLSV